MLTILHNPGSSSARNLQASLAGAGIVARRATANSVRQCRGDRLVINLGVSAEPRFRQRTITFSNPLEGVADCQDKRATFLSLFNNGIYALEWYDPLIAVEMGRDISLVRGWLEEDGKIVVRHTTTGHSGAGIQIVRRGQEIPQAPLYTRYFRKQAEYRVHIAFGKVILIQQKRKVNGFSDLEIPNKELVRTHGNGWVFTVGDLDCESRGYTDSISGLATAGITAVGCNHGAVDILVNHDTMQMVVCEINSCPALEANSTLAAYTQAFKEWIDGQV